MANARGEVAQIARYQYVLVNHYPPERTYACLSHIVEAERLRTCRYTVELDD